MSKKIVKKLSKKDQEIEKAKDILSKNGIAIAEGSEVVVDQTVQDFRSALLVVSIAINVAVLLTWIILQLTTKYDTALVSALLQR